MNLGEVSTLLAWGATTAYTIAFIAFGTDLARRADAAGRARAELGRARSEVARVAAGVVASAADPLPTADRLRPTPRPAGGHGAAGPVDPGAADPPGYRPGRSLGIAMAVTVAGVLLQTSAVLLRGLATARVPWGNMYEFTLGGTLVAVATFRLLCLRRDVRFLGAFVLGLSVLALGLGLTVFYVPAGAVLPALQSYWLVIHVTIAVAATGVFTVAVTASALQLVRDSWERDPGRSARRWWSLVGSMPSARALEALAFRLNALAFLLWTFTVMAGAVWAEQAWSRFWGWDPKEVWSFIVWVVYAAYLHARTTRGWSGRRAAWFSIVGYAVLIFNFTGVNLLLQGLHSYSGLRTGS